MNIRAGAVARNAFPNFPEIAGNAFAAALGSYAANNEPRYGRAYIMQVLRDKVGGESVPRGTIEEMLRCGGCDNSFIKNNLDKWSWQNGTISVGAAASGLMVIAKGGYATSEPLSKDEAQKVGIPT